MARRPPKRRSLRATLADRIGVSDVARSIHAHIGFGVQHSRSISNDLVAVGEDVVPYHYEGGARTTAWYPLNTGVPSGTSLTTSGTPTFNLSNGIAEIFASNVTYDSKLFQSAATRSILDVWGQNVTFTNCQFRCQIRVQSGASVILEDCEVTAEDWLPVCNPSVENDRAQATGVYLMAGAAGGTLTRCNLHGWGKAVDIGTGTPATLTDSWLHAATAGYCDGGGAATHMESLFVWPGSGRTVQRCYLDAGYDYLGALIPGNMATAAILLHGDPRTHSNSTYDANLMRGGNFAMYCANSNVTVTSNRFLRDANLPYAAFYGPRTAWDPAAGGTWSGNTYEDGTTPAP